MARLHLSSFLARAGATLLAGALLAMIGITPQSVHAASTNVVISQVYGGGGNSGATLKNDFIELFNKGASSVSLSGWSVQYGSATGNTWGNRTNLSGVIPPGGYYLIQEAAGAGGTVSLPTPDLTGSINMSGASGKVALVSSTTALVGENPSADPSVVDFIGYGSATGSETAPAPILTNSTSDVRAGDGCIDTDNNSLDFSTNNPATGTPPRSSATPALDCGADAAPTVSVSLPGGSSSVAPTANIDLTFSEPVDVAGSWFLISCIGSGVHTAVVSGGPQTFTLSPDADFTSAESCTVTVFAANVTDQDTNDGPDNPDNMDSDAVFNFTIADLSVCGTAATPIHDVQGNGATTPLPNALVTVEGVVIGSYQGGDGLDGFFLQEEDAQADGDPLTSEGLFIFDNGFNAEISVGDVARVTGRATEYSGQTELTTVTQDLVCGTAPLPSATDVTLPFAASDSGEPYEGMLVRMHQTLTVSEVYQLGQYGEVMLSNGRRPNPTNVVPPGPAALALEDANLLNKLILDDGSSLQDRDPTPYLFGPEPTLRVGDTVDDLSGVFGYAFGSYRIEPTGPAPFVRSNPRTPAPADVGGMLKVGAFNVLNFFNGDGLGGGFPTARGANTLVEYNRQRAKTVAAISAADPDIAGLMEMENDVAGAGPMAIEDLVNGLNAVPGADPYTFVDTGPIKLGTDLIRVAVIYKPSKVTPVGPYATILTGTFVDKSRPPIAQTFRERATGEVFTFVVNHLKSKGSCPADGDPNADQGDLQGCWNPLRIDSVNQELAWLATDPTGSGDPDYLVMGDMNAYAREDPIAAWEAGGYTNLIDSFVGADAYSYVFNGESGYIDHALGSASILSHVTGVTEWHNNAAEPTVLDYNMEYKSPAQQALNVGTPYRASDHDPVLVGLTLGTPDLGLSLPLAFGDQLVGSTSAAQDVTITNTGTAPLTVSAVSADDDFAVSGGTCAAVPFTLGLGGSCTVGVTFTPSTLGAHSGALTVASNAPTSPATVALTGTGTRPDISLSPASLPFGDQLVGATSAAQDVTITNTGTAPLTVSAVSAGDDFAISGGTCAAVPFSLASGASCTIGVTFTPSTLGAHTGTLTVASDAPASPHSVALTGTGTRPDVSLTPASLDFGAQVVSTTGAAQDVTVTNNGTALLTVSAVSADDDFAISGGTCAAVPFSLASGASCTVSVNFTPSTLGAHTGTLTVASDAPTSPATVALTGTGIAADLLFNGGFEINTNSDHVPDGWTAKGFKGPDGQDCSVAFEGACSLKLDGRRGLSQLTQVINTSGSGGDRFLFTIQDKADHVRGGGLFGAVITITYRNGRKEIFHLRFRPGAYDWRADSLDFEADRAYRKIQVTLLYGKDGTAWFDAASLTRQP